MTRFSQAIAAIDAANGDDPNFVAVNGESRPAELVYGERMSAMLGAFKPDASEVLRLAVRAQHLCRWRIPRSDFPMDRAGYLRWRNELKRKHAEWAGEILTRCGYDATTVARCGALIRKENLKGDAEAQSLEDVACLVFLAHYADDFASRHDDGKVVDILRKTLRKMSEAGRAAALATAQSDRMRSLLDRALASPEPIDDWQHGVAVVLAAHGDRAGDRPNATLLGHRDALAGSSSFRCVAAGVLKGDLTLETAIAEAMASGAGTIAVYPVFMSDGYFVGQVLPQRIAETGATEKCVVLAPLGLDPELPALIHSEAVMAATAARMAPETARLLIVGHGSELGPASANATRLAAQQTARLGAFAVVATAFLEEAPFIDDALADDALPTIVSGFFSGDGLHAGIDVPEAIRTSKAVAVYAGSIGASPAIPSLIARSVAAAMRQR